MNASPNIDELARQLARATGEDVETALRRAIEERLSRIKQADPTQRESALRKFFGCVSQMPVKDHRTVDQIMGYGPDGLPS